MAENIKKTYVIDASFILALLLPDEKEIIVDTFFDKYNSDVKLISTPVLVFEVLNGLKSAFIQKRLSEAQVFRLAEDFFRIIIDADNVDYYDCLDVCLKDNLSYYDASYLVLAKSKKVKLLTLDKRLKQFVS